MPLTQYLLDYSINVLFFEHSEFLWTVCVTGKLNVFFLSMRTCGLNEMLAFY